MILGFPLIGKTQTYSFKSRDAYQRFELQPEGDHLYCLFKLPAKKSTTTVFRKVFLSPNLERLDSIEYEIEGDASLLGSESDENTVCHAFYSKAKTDKIVFIITDKSGNLKSKFFKTVTDFLPYFQKTVKKLKNIQLSFIANNGSPGMLLIQPYLISSGISLAGKIFSLDAETGKELWASPIPPLNNIQTTDSLLIGLTGTQIHFVNKESGKLITTKVFAIHPQKYRTISVFTSNGVELMVAGSEFDQGSTKNGKFYMTMFSLNGEKVFDRVDSAARFSTRRMHLMGNVFDQNGNLVIVAEGWKPDATRMIATTAGSLALAVLTRGAYARVYTSGIDHKIDNLIFATLSPEDGRLINFKSFPVGPWLEFGRMITEGSRVLIIVSRQVILYDANEPNAPPILLTTLHTNENLILTPFGPVLSRWTGARTVLNLLH